ncbi:MAG: hypothetical protein GC162_04185 [Planctomycetes bacterium]|nr:hypothetical protein [Planctomycetota bacterium]
MKFNLTTLLIVLVTLALSAFAPAATITNTVYSSNTTLSSGLGDFFLEGTAAATWTINPGVTVTTTASTNRFFIDSNTNPDGTSTFIVTGGGTLDITSNNQFAMRLAHTDAGTNGVLTISSGSFVTFSNGGTILEGRNDGGLINLNGLGSRLFANFTYNTSTNEFNGIRVRVNGALPILTGSGANLEITSVGGGTLLTVIPTPAALPAGLALMGLLTLLHRK